MTKALGRPIAALLLAIQVSIPTLANDALQRIPENALGFAVVRNLAETSGKVDQLLQPFDVTFPSPLTLAKVVTGLDEGLDLSGQLVIAVLPGAGPQADLEPMVLLPVLNYAEFATSINADTSGEICRITLLGEDVLVAQDGPYAMLMNVEHHQTMQELVAFQAEPVTALTPLTAWLPDKDIALVLMPSGVEQISHWKMKRSRRFGLGNEFGRSRFMFSELLSPVWRPATRRWFLSNIDIAAIGITVDSLSNVRLSQQLILKANSPFAQIAPQELQPQVAKLGLSQSPFVFTAGGSVAPGWGKQLATYWRKVEQEQIAENGLENIPPELWEKEEQAFRFLLEDIRSCSVMMLPGTQGEPLLGNFFGIATVPDVAKYFESLPAVVDTWNEITELSTSEDKLVVELNPLKLTGETGTEKAGYEFVVDIASNVRDPNVPLLNFMYESALGPAGKLRVQLVGVDQTTFVFGLATRRQLAELLKVAPLDESTVPQSPTAQATVKLLQPSAQWKMLISPHGCRGWASRVANELLALLTNQEIEIPPISDSPAIGMTVNWIDRQWECEVLCPAETWEHLANYLGTVLQ